MTWPSQLSVTMGYSKDEQDHFSYRFHSVSSTACPALRAGESRHAGNFSSRDIK